MTEDSMPTILVVDDTDANLDVMVEILGDEYEVMVAMDGPTALELADEEPPDLILLDIMMPDMDGYEVLERLKASEKTKNIPVIFVTAKIEVEDEARGLELGAVDYIAKPVSPPVVLARVRTHMNLKLAREKLAEQNAELIKAAELKEDVERITRHDLKNPLQDVIALPQLMVFTDPDMDESKRDMLQRIEAAGKDMLRMINSSLDLYKMEQGVYRLNAEDVDLAQVALDALREFSSIAGSRQIALSLVADGSDIDLAEGNGPSFMVRGERLMLYSMLANLVRNACEAAPDGTFARVELDRGSSVARIIIANAGEVPEEIREKFFEKYATSGKAHGTGLGTYSARLIARTHGGDITMETGGQETTLSVSLPA